MKLLRILLAALFLFGAAGRGWSLNVSVGAMAWYAWWEPHFEDEFRGEGNPITATNPAVFSEAYDDSFSMEPALMYGPVLNFGFSPQWSLGLSFLMSTKYKFGSNYKVDQASLFTHDVIIKTDLQRYDVDGTLSYKLNRTFGLFLGYKYMRYETSNAVYRYLHPTLGYVDVDVERTGYMHGPGFGLSGMVPIVNTFFFNASLSGIVMKSQFRYWRGYSASSLEAGETINKSTMIGFNAMVGFGYYFTSLSTTVVVGGRYQYLKNDEDLSDKFYGLTFSAIYTF
ncbi:MAG TPA: hypothetical protein PLT75_16915 [Spirochaetota bacterium]|nr:hypothetical protein [Spirochaetota bacterium]